MNELGLMFRNQPTWTVADLRRCLALFPDDAQVYLDLGEWVALHGVARSFYNDAPVVLFRPRPKGE